MHFAVKFLSIFGMVLLTVSPWLVFSRIDAEPAVGLVTTTFYPVADGYVNSSSPDTNYGSLNRLFVGNNSEQEIAYIRFDLSSITSKAHIVSANLSVYLSSTGGDIYGIPADRIGAYYCSNTSWSELGFTWAYQPGFNPTPTDTWAFGYIYYMGYKTWNVTNDVRTAFPLGTITEVLKFDRKTGDGYAVFHSREGALLPTLDVTYSAPLTSLYITSTGGGTTEPVPGTYTQIVDTLVNVTAISHAGYSFDYWRLDGEARTENPIAIIMYANRTLEAVFVDDVPPEIGVPVQEPLDNIASWQNVTVTVTVNDAGSGVHNVTLEYRVENGTTWTPRTMTEIFPDTYQTKIPGYDNCTWITYQIIAYDHIGNPAIKDNQGYPYTYHVIPEFSPFLTFPILMIVTLLVTVTYNRKR